MKEKQCSICGQCLPATPEYFFRRKGATDGLRNDCKTCHTVRRRNYYQRNKEAILEKAKTYRQENADSIKASRREYYKENKEAVSLAKKKHYEENKDYYKEQFRVYREKHREALLAKDKEYNKNNRERRREYERDYYKQNPDKLRGKHNRRRSRRSGLKANLTTEQWEQICSIFSFTCAYCGQLSDLEQEHFVPLTQGGEYTQDNIIPACRSCNASKNDKDFFEWYPQQVFYTRERESRILQHLGYNKNKQSLSAC